jgi:hypothetical protein
MEYTGQPIPPPRLGYHAEPDPYNPKLWVIKATSEFGIIPVRRGRSRLTLRWYLLWYRLMEPIGDGS